MRAGVALALNDGYSISLCEPGASGEGLVERAVAQLLAEPYQ